MIKISQYFKLNHHYKKHRLFVILIAIIFLYVLYFIKIIKVAVFSDNPIISSYQKANKFRGDIIDRNGKMLATNILVSSIFMRPEKIKDKEYVFSAVTEILPDINKKEFLKNLNSDKNFVWIKRIVEPAVAKKIHDLGVEGIELEHEYKRLYIHSNLTSHLIGYVGIDNNGLAGIEKQFNSTLTNSNSNDAKNEAQNNSTLQLSIDIDIQYIVQEELQKAVQEFNAIKGTCIVVDPQTGEVIAAANNPDFNPHAIEDKNSLFPTAWYGLYEVGSVFKAIIFAIALDSKTAKLNEVYDIKKFNIGSFTVKDYHYHEKKTKPA